MKLDFIVDILIRRRNMLLLIAVLLAAVCYQPAQQMTYDRSIENMFADDDPLLKNYSRLKRTFGNREVVLAAYVEERGLDQPEAVEQLAQIAEELKKITGIETVFSYSDINQLPFQDKLAKLFEGYTHSVDGKTVAIICFVTAREDHRETISQMREVINPLPQGVLAGEPVLLDDAFRYLQEDGKWLYWSSLIVLSTIILILFRSIRWALITIAVVQLSLLVTDAIISTSGMKISMVSTMHTSVITVIAVATTVHLIVRYRSASHDRKNPNEALRYAMTLLLAPIFWACLTDAVGFAALLVINVGPVQDVAVMMIIGSLSVLLSVILIVPGLALLGTWDARPHRTWGEQRLDHALSNIVFGIDHYPRLIAWVSILSATLIGMGSFYLKLETDFTKNFHSKSPIVKSYKLVESRLGGAGVWDVMLPAPKNLNDKYLTRVLKLQDRLRKEVVLEDTEDDPTAGLTSVISLADLDPKTMLKSLSFKQAFEMMKSVSYKKAMDWVLNEMQTMRSTLHHQDPENPEQYYFRIMLRSREQQSSDNKQLLMSQVRKICQEEFPELKKEDPTTGFFVLLTNIINSILRDQWTAFAIATLAIAVMVWIAFRSYKLALIALVPNIFPIFVVTGLMGWSGVKVNMGAAMIAAVSMGLSVDSSIHYIATFRRLQKRGLSMLEILNQGHQRTGRAMIFSTAALISGFTALCLSNFIPTIYFGVLVSLSMLGGLIGNLLVLPLLLRWAFAKQQNRNAVQRN